MKSLSECYETLGINSGATRAEIKRAYIDLVKVWHPDRFTDDQRLQKKAEEKLKEINEAYEILQNRSAGSYHRPSSSRDGPKQKTDKTKQSAGHGSSQPRNNAGNTNAKGGSPDSRDSGRSPVYTGKFLAVFLTAIAIMGVLVTVLEHFRQPTPVNAPIEPAPLPTITAPTTELGQPFKMPPTRELEADVPSNLKDASQPIPASLDPMPTKMSRIGREVVPQANEELVRLRAGVLERMKEMRESTVKLLALNEAELARHKKEHERLRKLYLKGQISRNDVLKAEHALQNALLRVDQDRRWLAETDEAIRMTEEKNAVLSDRERLKNQK